MNPPNTLPTSARIAGSGIRAAGSGGVVRCRRQGIFVRANALHDPVYGIRTRFRRAASNQCPFQFLGFPQQSERIRRGLC